MRFKKIRNHFNSRDASTIEKHNQYYCVSDEELNKISYQDLCIKAHQNIFVMKEFGGANQRKIFTEQLSEEQLYYHENGYIILKNFIPHDIINRYLELRDSLGVGREKLNVANAPHMEHVEIRDIACYQPLSDMIKHLHSMEMGLIFSLTGFFSTERGWHQDSYLDPDNATPRCASWVALGDVDDKCGPFELIPKSNRWPALSNQKINQFLHEDHRWPEAHMRSSSQGPKWGRLSEKFIDPAVDKKLENEKLASKKFLAEKGDVLVWSGRLMHRGSTPLSKEAVRPALISHYAPIGEPGRGLFVKRKEGSYFLAPARSIDLLQGHSDIA